MPDKFYTAKYDRVFKTIFCNEKNLELLKEFLSRVLEIEIQDIVLLRNEIPVSHVKEKVKTVDVFLKCDDTYLHIELNTSYSKSLHHRNFNYFTSLYNRNIERGKRIDINIPFLHLDFTYGLGKHIPIRKEYYVMDKTKKRYIENFKIVEYNMDKIMEFWYSKDEKEIAKYKHFIILDLEREDLKKIMKGDKWMEAVGKSILDLNDEERFRSWMTKEEDIIVMANTEAYEEGKEQGIKQGREQGRVQGLEQGKILGLEQGRVQGLEQGLHKKAEEIAHNLLKENMDISFISSVTGMSEKEIQNLKR